MSHKQQQMNNALAEPSKASKYAIKRFHAFKRHLLYRVALRACLIYCMSTSSFAVASSIDENDLLLLDFTLDRQHLASSVTAYTYREGALISLAEAGAALEFPILVNPQAGTATGWFIRPERLFKLDIKQGYVEIEGKRQPISPDEVFVHDHSILVSMEVFSRWFPTNLQLKIASLSVEVEPRERLPVQERQARRRDAQRIGGVGPAVLPPIDNPYRLIGPPVADIGLGYSISRPRDTGKATTGVNYSALLANDLAYMDSRIYLNGTNKQTLSNARFTLSKDNLGLPLGLRYVELGDIVPVTVQGSAVFDVERGFLIQGGGSVVGRDDLIVADIININGDALPGWDVELLRNGMREGFQTIGPIGRYDFRGIQPLAGENIFELVFYGPSGERRSEKITRYSGLTPDLPGSIRYQFSVSEKGKQIYQPDEHPNQLLSNRGSPRLAAGLEMRVLPALALRGAWNSVVIDDDRLDYYTLGATTGWRDFTLGINATTDGEGDTRWDASAQLPASMKLWGFDTRFTHTQYVQSVLEQENDKPQLTSQTALTLNGPIGPASTRFSLLHNRQATRTYNQLSAGFTRRYQRFSFGNTLNYQHFGRDQVTGVKQQDALDGNFYFDTRVRPLTLRGGASYILSPEGKVHRYFIESDLNVANDMSMNFGISHDPAKSVTRYTSGLNWQHPWVTLSPRISYESDGEYSGFIYANLSMSPRPDRNGLLLSGRSMSGSGTVAARVFLDNDASGGMTVGDTPLPGVTVKAPQAYRSVETDEKGTAYLLSLSPERTTDILVAAETLPTADMTITHAGNSVRPRATAPVSIDFPVVITGNIEGHVYTTQRGSRAPLAGAMVELLNKKGTMVQFRVVANDGYFLFDQVPFGSYTLALGGDQRQTADLQNVTIDYTQSEQTNIEIVSRLPGTTELAALPVTSPATLSIAKPTTAPSPSVLPKPQPASTQQPALQPSAQATPIKIAPLAPLRQQNQQPPETPSIQTPTGPHAQLGAFSLKENAERYVKRLQARGILTPSELRIISGTPNKADGLHRVIAQPRTGTPDALCQHLKSRGEPCISVKP